MSNIPTAPKFDEASLEAELRNMGLDSDEINRFRRSSTDDEIKELMAACSPGGNSMYSIIDIILLGG